ncbi:hypothetical protein [Pseudoalteromonas lipolytica]|uniref:Uncharacterized protein n=1 Tax=Pseudoalteromonas lipolytica TaxID=570156 RepID=A0A0P7DYI4_9GAMM|nr:hypothetical protein [Pseudoalteromonas lipolytica]KPM82653.1 hypothetical protein AOG27_15200 [Pseudoalteromonas lipolytica]
MYEALGLTLIAIGILLFYVFVLTDMFEITGLMENIVIILSATLMGAGVTFLLGLHEYILTY